MVYWNWIKIDLLLQYFLNSACGNYVMEYSYHFACGFNSLQYNRVSLAHFCRDSDIEATISSFMVAYQKLNVHFQD